MSKLKGKYMILSVIAFQSALGIEHLQVGGRLWCEA